MSAPESREIAADPCRERKGCPDVGLCPDCPGRPLMDSELIKLDIIRLVFGYAFLRGQVLAL